MDKNEMPSKVAI